MRAMVTMTYCTSNKKILYTRIMGNEALARNDGITVERIEFSPVLRKVSIAGAH